MIFSVQRYTEDYFQRRGLTDIDQYAVKVANFYAKLQPTTAEDDALRLMHRIRTTFFRANTNIDRSKFESELFKLLRREFQKKSLVVEFPGGVSKDVKFLNKQRRRTIAAILKRFREAVEARAIDTFWQSRKQGKLARNPELIGQGLLAMFIRGVLSSDRKGLVLREVYSGIGYVDITVIFSNIPHLIEMKMLTSRFVGPSQLESYMKTEKRNEGWLVVFDARQPSRKTSILGTISAEAGNIKVVVVDINPTPPSHFSQ